MPRRKRDQAVPGRSCGPAKRVVYGLPPPGPHSHAGRHRHRRPGGAPAIPHPIEGDTYKDCTTCHGIGKLKPFPENHTSFAVDSCTSCHKPAATGGATTPEAGTTPEASGTATAARDARCSAIPHPIEGDTYKDCTTCHGAGKIKPFPANHASRSCTGAISRHKAVRRPAPRRSGDATTAARGRGPRSRIRSKAMLQGLHDVSRQAS